MNEKIKKWIARYDTTSMYKIQHEATSAALSVVAQLQKDFYTLTAAEFSTAAVKRPNEPPHMYTMIILLAIVQVVLNARCGMVRDY